MSPSAAKKRESCAFFPDPRRSRRNGPVDYGAERPVAAVSGPTWPPVVASAAMGIDLRPAGDSGRAGG